MAEEKSTQQQEQPKEGEYNEAMIQVLEGVEHVRKRPGMYIGDTTHRGLHGVGASVVNALSEWMEVEVSRDGKVHHMEFERGHKSSDLKVIGSRNQTGTKVTFKPDTQIFPNIEFTFEVLAGRMRELAYLNEGLQIAIEDERTGKREEFQFKQGLIEFVKHLNDGKNPLHPNIIYFKKEDPETRLQLEVAM